MHFTKSDGAAGWLFYTQQANHKQLIIKVTRAYVNVTRVTCIWQTFFFCMLKFSMMTPMKRLSVKNEPNMMKKTK